MKKSTVIFLTAIFGVITNIETVLSFTERLNTYFSHSKSKEMIDTVQATINNGAFSDIIRIIGITGSFIIFYIILTRFNKLQNGIKEQMIIFSIMVYKKSKDIMKSGFKNESEYVEYLKREYLQTRLLVQNNFPQKSQIEIDKIMFDFYPNEIKEHFKKAHENADSNK